MIVMIVRITYDYNDDTSSNDKINADNNDDRGARVKVQDVPAARGTPRPRHPRRRASASSRPAKRAASWDLSTYLSLSLSLSVSLCLSLFLSLSLSLSFSLTLSFSLSLSSPQFSFCVLNP